MNIIINSFIYIVLFLISLLTIVNYLKFNDTNFIKSLLKISPNAENEELKEFIKQYNITVKTFKFLFTTETIIILIMIIYHSIIKNKLVAGYLLLYFIINLINTIFAFIIFKPINKIQRQILDKIIKKSVYYKNTTQFLSTFKLALLLFIFVFIGYKTNEHKSYIQMMTHFKL